MVYSRIMKGWIALDIDGTITLDKYSVPGEVVSFLRKLHGEGWNLVLATGRPFTFASMTLKKFDFPYTLLCQNGSVALEMPHKKLIFTSYIPTSAICFMEKAYEGMDSDFLIYAGYEHGDFCFWRPKRFTTEETEYLIDLQTRQNEKWQAVEHFDDLFLDAFPLIKCFGHESRMGKIAARLKESKRFEVANIRDPFVEGIRILLVTDIHTSKGKSLSKVLESKGRGGHVIAAGDDENDISLLSVADTKIAMHHSPESLIQIATFIAPPTQENGIIQALQLALRKNGN